MSATSASPRSHVDSFSLVLPKRLDSELQAQPYPHRALAPLSILAQPLLLCSPSKHPACSPSPFTSLTHRGIRRDPPSAARSIHTPSPRAPCLRVGTRLPSCGSCAFSPALSRFPSSSNHFPQHTGTLQRPQSLKEEMSLSPTSCSILPLLAALVTKHLRRTANTAASFPFFPFFP